MEDILTETKKELSVHDMHWEICRDRRCRECLLDPCIEKDNTKEGRKLIKDYYHILFDPPITIDESELISIFEEEG